MMLIIKAISWYIVAVLIISLVFTLLALILIFIKIKEALDNDEE